MAGSTRTYGQMCGLAASLDLLGERWTLLIIRELGRGPKRFRDLLDGLEGIGTNLLSARLKSLMEARVVERVTLPAPAGVAAYDLGSRGRALGPILEDLALWGFGLLVDYDRDSLRSRAAWAAMSMQARMDRSDRRPPEGIFAFEIGEESFWLRIADGGSLLRDGAPPSDPDVRVALGKEGFLAMATGASTPAGAGARIEGDGQLLESLLETFSLPPLEGVRVSG